jgi:hypothetical protein
VWGSLFVRIILKWRVKEKRFDNRTHLKDEAELAQPSLVWLKIVSEGSDTLKKFAEHKHEIHFK